VLTCEAEVLVRGHRTKDSGRIPVRATVISGPERDELYARQVERRPGFADYEKKTTRKIPVIALEPVGDGAGR
jgi:hypothetical protein